MGENNLVAGGRKLLTCTVGVGIHPLHLLMPYPRMPSGHDMMSPHPHPPFVPSRDTYSPLLHCPGWCRGHVTTPPSPLRIAMGRDTMSPRPLRLSWHTAQHRRSHIALVQGTQHDDTPSLCMLPWDATQSCPPWCLSWHTTQHLCNVTTHLQLLWDATRCCCSLMWQNQCIALPSPFHLPRHASCGPHNCNTRSRWHSR